MKTLTECGAVLTAEGSALNDEVLSNLVVSVQPGQRQDLSVRGRRRRVFVEKLVLGDILPSADNQRHSLVQRFRLDIEDSLQTCRSRPSRLLHDHGQRSRLVKQPQFSFWPGVQEDAPLNQIPVKIGDERSDIA